MTEDRETLHDDLRALVESLSAPADPASFLDGSRVVRRHRRAPAMLVLTSVVVVVVLVVGIAFVVSHKSSPNAGRHSSSSPLSTTSSTSVRIANGIQINFATATSSALVEAVAARFKIQVDDAKRFGHPLPPSFCGPAESYSGAVISAGKSYVLDGWAPIGSNAPIRVLQYGSNDRFVDVVARAYDPEITSIDIQLSRPAASGRMTALGDHWFVFAVPVGSSAPWYVQGTLHATSDSGRTLSASIPEGLESTPC